MSALLSVVVLLWSSLSWRICDSSELQVTVANRSGSTSCLGDLVTFTCANGFAHQWRISSVPSSVFISRIRPTFPDPGDPPSVFTIITTADVGAPLGNITTALSVISSAELNGSNIECSDSNVADGEPQEATLTVFGPPSAPVLTSVLPGGDLVSFDFTITPSTPPDCVVNYIITAASSDGSRTIPVAASEVDGSTPVNVRGFNRCSTNYSFTVAPMTNEGTGPSSGSMDIAALDPDFSVLVPNVTLTTSEQSLDVVVSWQVEDDVVNTTIGWSAPGGTECVNSTTVDAAVMQKNVSLNCDYDGNTVIFCVQFTATSGCPSMQTVTEPRTVSDAICLRPTEAPDSIAGPAAGGAVGGSVAVIVAVVIMITIIVSIKKKKGGSSCNKDKDKPTVTYHSAGATPGSTQTAVTVEEHAPGAMYANPKEIEHQAATETGDQYALITSNTKAKKKNGGQPAEPAPHATAELGDMYSVPDKTKKKQNEVQGLVYADIDVGQPQNAPRNRGSQKQAPPPPPDEEPVTYATVTSPM